MLACPGQCGIVLACPATIHASLGRHFFGKNAKGLGGWLGKHNIDSCLQAGAHMCQCNMHVNPCTMIMLNDNAHGGAQKKKPC